MKTPHTAQVGEVQGETALLDEEFFILVDRTMLAHKQRDPLRLDQVHRAAQEEARLANMTNVYDPTPQRRRDRE